MASTPIIWDTDLDAVSAGPAAPIADGDKGDIVVSGGGSTWLLDAAVVTAAGKALLDDANAAAQRATLGLGTAATAATGDFEAAGAVATHAATTTTHGISTFGASLVDDADASEARTTLGLGTAATQATGAFAAASHSHAATDITSGTVDTARLGSGTADGTTFLRGDQTWATPSGGSDPWTIVTLGSDFTTSSASNTNVTGLAFTPSASKTYLVYGYFLLRTATATVGARPGLSWPSGLSDGASLLTAPNSNTALAFRAQGAKTTQNAASTGLPTTTDSYLGTLEAVVITGGSPSGDVQVTLASETGGTNVTMKAGSFLMYREIS